MKFWWNFVIYGAISIYNFQPRWWCALHCFWQDVCFLLPRNSSSPPVFPHFLFLATPDWIPCFLLHGILLFSVSCFHKAAPYWINHFLLPRILLFSTLSTVFSYLVIWICGSAGLGRTLKQKTGFLGNLPQMSDPTPPLWGTPRSKSQRRGDFLREKNRVFFGWL